MTQVNILEAKNELSKLIRLLEMKQEDTVVIARNGVPVVQMILYPQPRTGSRIGTARGKFSCPDDMYLYDDELKLPTPKGCVKP